MSIRLTRLPGERGRLGKATPYLACGCGCACCCCCCCLHSVGAFVGALTAQSMLRVSESVPVSGRSSATDTGEPISNNARRILGAFALFRAAEQLRVAGRLVSQRFEAVASLARSRAQAEWDKLYSDNQAATSSWNLDRIGMLIDSGNLPAASRPHFEKMLAEKPQTKTKKPPPRGSLAHLWRLHLLYQEIQAAVDAGVVDARSLGDVRGHLFEHILRLARDLGGYQGDGATGHFQGQVLDEARSLLSDCDSGGTVFDEESRAALASVLSGGEAEAAPVEGSCKVCGDALSAFAIAHCASCETPHHQACFEYNGRCATFACGCTQIKEYVEAGTPLRFDLREGPSRELDFHPASRANGLFWICALGIGSISWRNGAVKAFLFAPVILLAAVLLACLLLFFTPPAGRREAFSYLGMMAIRILLGTLIGAFLMSPILPFLGIFK